MKKLFLLLLVPLFLTGCSYFDSGDKTPQVDMAAKIKANQDQGDSIDTSEFEIETDVEAPEPAVDTSTIMEPPLNVDAEIAELFVEKYDYDFSEVSVTVDDYDSEGYARGMVELGEGGPGNQGGYLAALTDGGWVLVFDGNGFYDCEEVISYGFPEYMAPDCY